MFVTALALQSAEYARRLHPAGAPGWTPGGHERRRHQDDHDEGVDGRLARVHLEEKRLQECCGPPGDRSEEVSRIPMSGELPGRFGHYHLVVTNTKVSADTDEELMAAWSNGAVEAFEALFGRYQQPIWSYFRRRLSEPARAEDLTQDTFVAVMRAATRYEGRASFRTYLYGIASNLLATERRRARPTQPLPVLGATTSHDEALFVRQALNRLDDSDREILLLREFEDLSYAEIADLLDIPVNTVRSRLFRARIALRDLLSLGAQPERQSS
jgi:RNA polymerase sigma-70 factor (ECF subfamily)